MGFRLRGRRGPSRSRIVQRAIDEKRLIDAKKKSRTHSEIKDSGGLFLVSERKENEK